MQPEQIPQVQIPPQNIQIPIANQPVQPQFYQVIQTESPNTCEKCSKFFTDNGFHNINDFFSFFHILLLSFRKIFWWLLRLFFIL